MRHHVGYFHSGQSSLQGNTFFLCRPGRQSSLIGGGGRKNIWGSQINFPQNFGREDQKKRYSPEITPRRYGPFASFRGTILARGTFLAWRGATEPYDADLGSSPQSHGWRPKEGLWHEILGFVLAFTRVFRLGTRLYSRLVGTSSDLRGHGPEMPSVAPGLHRRFSNNSRHSKHIKLGRHGWRSRLSRYGKQVQKI